MDKDLTIQFDELMEEINFEVKEATEAAFNAIAKETVQDLRNNSPKKTGDYAKGWTSKKAADGYVVYNKTDWQLTNLLEDGHAIVNKKGRYGRVNGIKHIEPARDKAAEKLPIEILRGIK